MPPKPKFTKEEVAAVALNLVKEEGVSALTARALSQRLGSSPTPIFTVFKSMDEVKGEARKLALMEFEEYTSDYTEYTPAFKRLGMQMIAYAVREPELYKLLFMQENREGQGFEGILSDLGSLSDVCITLIMRDYGMERDEATALFTNMWVYTFGIGAMCANRVCRFSEEEISEHLSQIFAGMVMLIKSDKIGHTVGRPQKKDGAPA